MADRDDRPHKLPRLFNLRRDERFIGLVVGFAVFTDLFLYGLVVPVLPYALTSRFNIAQSQVLQKTSVLLAIYAVGLLVACPIVGWFADRSKARRTPLLLGLLALLGSTLLFALGRTYALLVVARLLQGISAAVVWTVGLALMADTVGPERLGVAMGVISVFMSVGAAAGPVIGGILYDVGGFYAPFYLAFGFIAVDIVLRFVIIEKSTARRIMIACSGPSAAPSELPLLLPGHDGHEVNETGRRKSRVPAIIKLLGSPRLLTACWLGFISSLILSSCDTVLPLYLQKIWNFSALGAGLVYGALVLPTFISSPFAGWWIDTRGTKGITILGLLLEIPFLVALRFPNGTSPRVGQVVEMCFILALNAIGVSFILTASLTEIALNPAFTGRNAAQAYALFNMTFSAGTLVGPLISSAIAEKSSWATMCWSLALFCAVSLPICLFYIGEKSLADTHWIKSKSKMSEKSSDAEARVEPQTEVVNVSADK